MVLSDPELITEFVVESQERLADIEIQLLSIEAAGESVSTELVNAVFRTMHSIKGAAGFLGLSKIEILAHGLEEVLNHLRNRQLVPSAELVTALLRASDFIKCLLASVDVSNEADVMPYLAVLERLRPGKVISTACQPVKTSRIEPRSVHPPVARQAPATPAIRDVMRDFLNECLANLDRIDEQLTELEREPASESRLHHVFCAVHCVRGSAGFLGLSPLETLAESAERLLTRIRQGQVSFGVEVASGLLALVDKLREGLQLIEQSGSADGLDCEEVMQLLNALGSAGELRGEPGTYAGPSVVPSLPSTESPSSSSNGVATAAAAAAAICDHSAAPDTGTAVVTPPAPEAGVYGIREPASGPVGTPTEAGGEAVGSASGPGDRSSCASAETSIRVDVALLDKLMTRVGELVLARNQVLQFSNNQTDASFLNTAQRLNLITTELQEGVMKTRMQPIGNVWAKFPRVVRDLASQLGKQVRIEMDGKETELDRTIVDAIKDPLTHLVRNSVDHGIEQPDQRVADGKPPEGCLSLRAYHEGGQVNIEITDDGAGLKLDRIRDKAIERGLITATQAAQMSERQIAQLVFLPGFSTAEQVTSVSGRGVGMDVVKTNIERIGGTLDIHSQPGRGTTVKVKIPLTLAIIPALIVTNDMDRYAIPQASLTELVRLEGDQMQQAIEFVHGAPVYRLRGKLLPLVYFSQTLGHTARDCGGHKNLAAVLASAAGEVDLALSRSGHLAWKQRLRNFLDGQQDISVEDAASPHACTLGKWLYSDAMRALRRHPLVERLEREHAEMHAAVGRLIQHRSCGDFGLAEGTLEEVENLSQRIVHILDQLQLVVAGAQTLNIVVLRADDRQFGLVVDAINDTEEIVVK
ncbi:MAG: Hpt domain-containing protein, partial [Pirellulaceae bacterium]